MFLRALTAGLLITAIGGTNLSANEIANRVVSLDFCADQFVLKLLPPDRILALSPDAERDFSYMRAAATGLPKVRPVAEDVLTIEPGLIVRSYGGGPHATKFFERAGVQVIQVPYGNSIAGIRDTVRSLAHSLGVPQRGADVIADFDRRLLGLVAGKDSKSALYMTPTGVTSGPGTLVHEMLVAAGLSNFQELEGWRSIPLERLAYERPDVVVAAFFHAETKRPAMWSPMRHPIAKLQISERPTVSIQGAWTACGGWFLLDAVESLAELSRSRTPQ